MFSPSVEKVSFDFVYDLAKAENKDENKVKRLSPDLINKPANGMTPVEKLAQEADHSAVKFLLEHGASVKDAIKGYNAKGHINTQKKLTDVLNALGNQQISIDMFIALADEPVHRHSYTPGKKSNSI